MPKKRFIALCLCILLGGACAPSVQKAPEGERYPPAIVPPKPAEISLFGSTKDTDLFNSALSLLNAPVNGQASAGDHAKARSDLEALLKTYPKSKWRSAAEQLIILIDEGTSSRQRVEKSLADKNRLSQENEQLKRQMRVLNEKLQAETTGLTQDNEQLKKDNEQLKKDIQTLKNLDIELEKRDRKLR